MIYCCPHSEWFLLGANCLSLEGRIASLLRGELQFAPTAGQFASYWGSELQFSPRQGNLPPIGGVNCLPLEGRIAIRPYKCATTPLEGIFHGLLSSISLSVHLFAYMARPARIIRSLSLRSFLRRALKPFLWSISRVCLPKY